MVSETEQAVCTKCGAEVEADGWFWVLPEQVGTGRATFCPADGKPHEVDDDET